LRIVLDGLRGENSISELCRREGIAQSAMTLGGSFARAVDKMPCRRISAGY